MTLGATPQTGLPPRLGARFERLVRLGAGAGGTVWRARDRLRDSDVAIKLLRDSEDGREFTTLRALQHPGTVRVLDVGFDLDDRPWFSMELARGVPFGAPGTPSRPPAIVITLLARLLEAVGFVHDRGWVHGDLKPDNVLASPSRGCVTVIDFGLALAATGATDLRGSAGYIAPEVLSGLRGVSIRSDLYAVGVIGWTTLTGSLPFAADDPTPGFRGPEAQAAVDQAPPRAQAVLGWLTRLLQADIDLRPRSAREAIDALEACTGRSLRDPADAAARLAPTPLVGRDDVLESTRRAVSQGRQAVVCGPSGSGRTATLRAVHDVLRVQGRRSLLVDVAGSHEEAWANLSVLVAEAGQRLSPLARVGHDEAADVVRERLAVHREDAVGAVVRAMEGARDRVWLLDCPEPESLAASVLIEAAGRTLVPAAFATTEEGAEAVLALRGHAGQPPLRVRLRPWTPAEVATWLGLALGRLDDAAGFVEAVLEFTAPLPGPMSLTLGALLRAGAVVAGETGWSWDRGAVADVGTATETLVDGLPAGGGSEDHALALEAMAIAALACGELRAARQRLAVGFDSGALDDASAPLRSRLLRLRAQIAALLGHHGAAAGFYRAVRTGDACPGGLERARLALDEVRASQEAGDFLEALTVLEAEAAAIARAGDLELHFDAARLRSTVLMRLGRFGDAREVAARWLRDLGPSAPARWTVALEVILANCDWHQGHPDRAEARCARLVADSSLSPVLRATALTTRGTALGRLGRHEEAEAAFLEARPLFEGAQRLLDAARVTNNVGILRYQQRDWIGAIEAFDRFRGLVSRLGNAAETGSAQNNLGVLFRDTGQLDRAERALTDALGLARRHGFARLEPMALGNLAEVAAVRGRGKRAEELYAEAIALSEARGIVDEQVECWRRLAQRRIDDRHHEGALVAISRARALANATDAAAEIVLLDGLEGVATIRAGDAPGGIERVEAALLALGSDGDGLEAARLRLRLGEALADGSQLNDAADLLDAAEPPLRRLGARPELQRLEAVRQFLVAATRNKYDQLASHYAALQELTLALSQETDLEVLLELILDRTLELVGFERGYVLLINGSGEPALRASRMLSREEIDKDLVGPSGSVTRRVLSTRRRLVALDIDEDDSLGKTASITAARLRSVICVPILRGVDLLGIIYVDSRTALGGSADEKAALLTACADAASVAIENARLVEALRRKNDSLAILAHELRTPLHALIGLSSLVLEGGPDGAEVMQLVAQMKNQGQRMATMISQVLSLARMETSHAEWERERIHPIELVVAARDTLVPIAGPAGVTLEATVADDAPETLGDADRLVQVLVNLLGNAVKFSPAGGVVHLRADRSDAGGLRVVVEDRGPGIPEERLHAVFEAFAQAGDPSMRRLGVGLGLAISRQIAQEHGGTLTAANRPEGGARFELCLPPIPSEAGDA